MGKPFVPNPHLRNVGHNQGSSGTVGKKPVPTTFFKREPRPSCCCGKDGCEVQLFVNSECLICLQRVNNQCAYKLIRSVCICSMECLEVFEDLNETSTVLNCLNLKEAQVKLISDVVEQLSKSERSKSQSRDVSHKLKMHARLLKKGARVSAKSNLKNAKVGVYYPGKIGDNCHDTAGAVVPYKYLVYFDDWDIEDGVDLVNIMYVGPPQTTSRAAGAAAGGGMGCGAGAGAAAGGGMGCGAGAAAAAGGGMGCGAGPVVPVPAKTSRKRNGAAQKPSSQGSSKKPKTTCNVPPDSAATALDVDSGGRATTALEDSKQQ